MLIIGERLTSGNPSVKAAILARDRATIAGLAHRQAQAGVDYLDIGTAALGGDCEPDYLSWLVETAQEATDLPLSLDCQNPAALGAALPSCALPPILNSFSGMVSKPQELLALIRENQQVARVVAVCINAWGERPSLAERVEIANDLAVQLADAGISEERIIFDPVTLPKSSGVEAEQETLATISHLRERFPRSGVLCAVSNYSYGLRERRQANRDWARQTLDAGANVFLCDPLDARLTTLLAPSPLFYGAGEGA